MTNEFKLDLTRRPRRMRRTASLRALASETEVLPQHLIQPVFVIEGEGAPEAIDSMPGIFRLSIKDTVSMAFAEAKATVRTSTNRAGSCVSMR